MSCKAQAGCHGAGCHGHRNDIPMIAEIAAQASSTTTINEHTDVLLFRMQGIVNRVLSRYGVRVVENTDWVMLPIGSSQGKDGN